MATVAVRIIPRVSLHFDLSDDLTANRQTKNNGKVIIMVVVVEGMFSIKGHGDD